MGTGEWGAVEQTFPESIDEILNAVKETPRGRWFLDGYEKRLRSSESERILDSIAKLERHIQSVSGTGHDGETLQKARDAIAAARRDIAAIDQKPAELSTEGQLFAKLAALSKQSFSGPPAVSKGVERALRLVSDLDQQLGPAQSNTLAAPEYTTVKDADPFKADEAIFEPAPPPKPIINTSRTENPEIIPRGAKLVIQHKPIRPMPEAVAANAGTPLSEQAPATTDVGTAVLQRLAEPKATPAAEASDIQHSRIVIIRRKAEDMEHVPLLEPTQDNPASAA
jgi:hypothetical protein